AARPFEEIRSLSWGFNDQLELLKNKLLYVQAFLDDLGTKSHEEKSQVVKLWLMKLKDVAYSADNILDDHAYELLCRKFEPKKKIYKFFNISSSDNNPILFRFELSYRVKKIVSKLEKLEEEAQKMGLKQVKLAREAVASSIFMDGGDQYIVNLNQVRKHAAASDYEFVGREIDQEKLLEVLCNPINNGDLSTIAIVGIGGLGKTTLARRLYEHEKVDAHFNKKKVWICVSENFDIERLLKEMVESLTSGNCNVTNTGAVINKLQGELKEKKFLLVLDDVWNNNLELWDSFKNELQRIGDIAGSVVLITTRSIGVAEKARTVYTHKLEGLSENDGWALLKHNVFVSRMLPSMTSSFEDVGRRIVEKCKGVPLALKAIRGLLQLKKHPSEWESIERSELWNLPQDDENYILPSLFLSFKNLPCLSLKQCFACSAIFRKDSLIDKGQLIALWLAQGFLHESGTSMEETGEKYFQILLNNSFLQEEIEDDETGEIMLYKMHDLVHDLAVYIWQKDLLVWNAEATLHNSFDFRHLVINFGETEIEAKTPVGVNIQKLRTVSFWGGVPRWDMLICAMYLRTLIMANIGLTEVSPAIGQLKHLRYLDLSYNPIKTLPDIICKLYQLQTLSLQGCKELKQLPQKLHKMVSLRHILTSDYVFASRGLQQFTCLQTLPHLELRDGEGWTIDELEPLHQVMGLICIKGLEHVKGKEEARKVGLGRKCKVLKLSLSWAYVRAASSENTDEDVLGGLEPHPNITSLELASFKGMRFPSWIMKMAVNQRGSLALLSNLTVVKIDYCSSCEQLPTLGLLPCLNILKLTFFHGMESIGNEFYVGDHDAPVYQSRSGTSEQKCWPYATNLNAVQLFPALRHLLIWEFSRLATWKPPPLAIASTAFPCLETLKVGGCPQLDSIPSEIIKFNNGSLTSLKVYRLSEIKTLSQELPNCTNLQRLEIWSCSKLESLPTGLQSLVYLQILDIRDCLSLDSLPQYLFRGLSSLRELIIDGCTLLTRIPTSIQECTSLEYLRIKNCPLIEDPVPDLSRLEGLVTLTAVNSGKLMTSVLRSISHLHCLKDLEIGGFEDEEEFRRCFSYITPSLSNQSLIRLTLRDCANVKLLPQKLQLILTSIKYLIIQRFPALDQLPEWIGDLSSLEILEIWNCKVLKFLPSTEAMRRLTQLKSLQVGGCPLLKKRCQTQGT
uniref:Uncharacterized protein n=2 Tax=Chenopodium quinoa TaxID=63459 RepID=A0A803LV32_CHEQI